MALRAHGTIHEVPGLIGAPGGRTHAVIVMRRWQVLVELFCSTLQQTCSRASSVRGSLEDVRCCSISSVQLRSSSTRPGALRRSSRGWRRLRRAGHGLLTDETDDRVIRSQRCCVLEHLIALAVHLIAYLDP